MLDFEGAIPLGRKLRILIRPNLSNCFMAFYISVCMYCSIQFCHESNMFLNLQYH